MGGVTVRNVAKKFRPRRSLLEEGSPREVQTVRTFRSLKKKKEAMLPRRFSGAAKKGKGNQPSLYFHKDNGTVRHLLFYG